MRKFTLFFILIALFFIQNIAYSAITVSASKSNIPRGQASVVTLTYQFTDVGGVGAPVPLNCYVESDKGFFMVGNEIIEVNLKYLRVNIINNYGTAVETLNIPVRVLERAIKKGFNTFQYVRTFNEGDDSCGGYFSPTSSFVNFSITTGAAADFDIKRIELYFENRRAEITIPKYYEGLKVFVDIMFTGSGLLQGYWEVDGRILSYVNQHIPYGKIFTLQIPETPPLPTFEPGAHIVRFVITRPEIQIPIPLGIYFVTTDEIQRIFKIKLYSPENDAKLDFASVIFEWEKLETPFIYIIQFFESEDSVPIFSAYTKNGSYTLSEVILNKIFQPNKKYFWKVIGFDSENKVIAESEIRSFSFTKTEKIEGTK